MTCQVGEIANRQAPGLFDDAMSSATSSSESQEIKRRDLLIQALLKQLEEKGEVPAVTEVSESQTQREFSNRT